MIRRLARCQEGNALILVLAFMALAVPLVTSGLGLASTLSIASRVRTQITKDQYSSISGGQHAVYRLVHEDGYAQNLSVGVPDDYTITVDGNPIDITVLKLGEPTSVAVPPPADDSRRLQASKIVSPTSTTPFTPTVFTYTISVINRDNDPSPLRKIHDDLPPGFSYLPHSTSGVTNTEPSVSGDPATGQSLTWNLADLHITLQPEDSVILIFQVQASVATGNYCNVASWVEPGQDNTTSGMTARVRVGNPIDELCQGAAASVSTSLESGVGAGNTDITLTYSIVIENIGNVDLHMSRVRDLLPEGFTNWVPGSVSGDVTSDDPHAIMWQGRQRLTWDFNPEVVILPGETKTIAFDLEANIPPGFYWNEVWVTFDEFSYTTYTWPSAVLELMAVFEINATNGGSTLAAEMWLGLDSHILSEWNIAR